jgi:hypothetical protein
MQDDGSPMTRGVLSSIASRVNARPIRPKPLIPAVVVISFPFLASDGLAPAPSRR